MKISFNWLKDYIHLSINPHQLADKLSLCGLEVEEVIEKRLDYQGVVVGKVISVDKHPNADKLSVCKVDIGKENLSIICGAPNVAVDQFVPVAKIDASLPNGLKIRRTKIRGVESEGMICSEAELGLKDQSDGIWILPDNLSLGIDLNKALDFKTDYIFDIAVTPNRPDCLSHIGIAREVSALTNKPLKKPEVKIKEIDEIAEKYIKIKIETPKGCPRYSARLIRNVTIKESPRWLVERLEAIGLRSINNVVDITNYVLMETGHPLHAFDHHLIKGQEIIVRESKKGERFTTLDDIERELPDKTVLICDAKKAVAIGGIMGGLNSEVNNDTQDILLESAYFNPQSIQRSSRYLALSTEASQRFERGADPNGNIYALERATQLIVELCGGEVLKGIVDAYPNPTKTSTIVLKVNQINNLLGTQLSEKEMKKILESIELQVSGQKVTIPTFRPDLKNVADLSEEIARHYGLDNIIAKKNIVIDYQINQNTFDFFINDLKEICVHSGLQETITSSMINSNFWKEITGQQQYPILNPISKDMDGLRNSLIPSLTQVIQHNQNRQIKNLRLFEVNKIFLPIKNLREQPEEELRLTIAITGKNDNDQWYSNNQDIDFYDIKGIVEYLCHKISLDKWQLISYSHFTIEGGGLALSINDDHIGFLGQLNTKIANKYEIEGDVLIADFSIQKLFNNRITEKNYRQIPRFPSVDRDLALIVDEDIEAQKIIDVIYKNGSQLLKDVLLFDIYRGKQISENKKSLAFRLFFQSSDRTLNEEEVNEIMSNILKTVKNKFEANLRE